MRDWSSLESYTEGSDLKGGEALGSGLTVAGLLSCVWASPPLCGKYLKRPRLPLGAALARRCSPGGCLPQFSSLGPSSLVLSPLRSSLRVCAHISAPWRSCRAEP